MHVVWRLSKMQGTTMIFCRFADEGGNLNFLPPKLPKLTTSASFQEHLDMN